ncbi:putative nucleotidyltransferase substrate binding domain-containing protein [Estrella lausannensis]|uniref:Putative nucleotidyltransferase n=1 Tax=Estrella lausannensis TaxID=483423 RepID=A0A0H5DNX5_9BACT|nr:putative nucleotidyltransferase substrate binding domain-containing protein [Estrella lausannensis]CRX38027.1 Putative nucleotidyltransferase [Estrella lausannensis]
MNSYNIPVNSSFIPFDGIHHYQELIIKHLDQEDKTKAVCHELVQFLQNHAASYNQTSLANCQKRLQKILSTDGLKEKKIANLFGELQSLASAAPVAYQSQRNPIQPSRHEALSLLSQQMSTIATIRKNLKDLKRSTQEIVVQGLLTTQSAKAYGQYFEKRFNAILQNILFHAVKKMEQRGIKGPDMTQWTALVLGSLARGEGHPYSDIDMVILIDPSLEGDNEARKYFENLMQEVSDLVHQVGEEAEGFKLCGGNLTPPYMAYPFRFADKKNSPDAIEGGMGSFIATPHRLAILCYQSATSYVPMKRTPSMQLLPITGNENLIAPSLLDAKPIIGNETLFTQFYELRKMVGSLKASSLFDASRYSDTPWKEDNTAQDLFYKSILAMSVHGRGAHDFEKEKVNIKKDFMRPIQMGISVLAAKFDLQEKGTADRIDALASRGFFKKREAGLLKETYLTLYKMRIEESALFSGENDDVALSEKAILEAAEEQHQKLSEFCKLRDSESALLASKKEGRESVADLIRNRLLQDAYLEEINHLSKFTALNRVIRPETFDTHKAVCTRTIDSMRKYHECL